MRAIGYIRVSTEMQAEGGVSLDAQRAAIAQYCALYEFELIDIESDEGISGKTLVRPGLMRAFERMECGEAQMLVIVKLDRLTRSVKDLGLLLERYFGDGRFNLTSVSERIDTTSAAGRLTLNILTSVAQWEREVISERISTAMQHMKTQGKRVGYVPFGKQLGEDGVFLKPHQPEQEVLELIASLRDEGLSLRKIAAHLNEREILNRQRPWNHETVRSKLRLLEQEDASDTSLMA